MDDASARQIAAARPDRSTWLSANAGSGKTRVLTDRVARLLLHGASPQNILCLTYTKAAASEMQNRLFRRLGEWAMMPEAELHATLRRLGEEDRSGPRLAAARRLFAQAIETPGGLRIQTIHSFCASLLRRFPLEAGISPRFTEMDDTSAAQLRTDCVERLAEDHPALFAELAATIPAGSLDALAREVAGRRGGFAPADAPAIRAALGLDPEESAERILADTFLGNEADLLAECCTALAAGKSTDQKAAATLAQIRPPFGLDSLAALEGPFLFGATAKEPFGAKTASFPTKDTRAVLGETCDALHALMERVAEARPRRLGLALARRSDILNRFAERFLALYAGAKQARGWLDFDDLILGARALLSRGDVADWVLYRLDGGLDHILVDEAQDTSPPQWQVIEALTREFAAGHGARATPRTLFVVGDRKQSIYSFQGADPEGFERMHDRFAARAGAADLARLELRHSFRSAPAILGAVDATFAGLMGGDVGHVPFRAALPGRVDLWPLVDPEDKPDDAEWFDPVDRPSPQDAEIRLAGSIARWIRALVDDKVTIPDRDDPTRRRPVHAGDILILVRGRFGIFHPLIRACKAEGIDIAGADVLRLADDLAVKDILALLSVLALPEDDLSLACALRSPLFGLTEGDLYRLARGRDGRHLWQALRAARAEFPEAMAMLDDLMARADYLRPFELIDRILLRHRGRERLLGRLGPESMDAIDALLAEALAYERTEAPSLTGFLAWFARDDVTVKRQAEGSGDRLRVMTVHGAKGLEAPVVILPETTRSDPGDRDRVLQVPDGPLLWRPSKAERPPALDALAEAREAAQAAERDRLLYVAMTRAETWLVVCGTGPGRALDKSWYGQVAAGLSGLATAPLDTPAGTGLRHAVNDWEAAELHLLPEGDGAATTRLPGWFDAAAPAPRAAPAILSPSDLGGAKALPGAEGEDEATATLRGTGLHLLLEHLPVLPRAEWEAAAPRLLAADPALPPLAATLLAEARAVLDHPETGPLLARPALTEVALAAPHPSGARIAGTVDRLLVEPDRVLAIDYKSNRVLPAGPGQVPEGLLRQMGAYGFALAQVYPDRRVDLALLWTAGPALMALDTARALAAFEGGLA